jgi:hypothetical protein
MGTMITVSLPRRAAEPVTGSRMPVASATRNVSERMHHVDVSRSSDESSGNLLCE